MRCDWIIVMRIAERTQAAAAVQETLTRYGCHIRARLGLHDVGEDACAGDGLVILQVCGEAAEVRAMHGALDALAGVTAKLVDLND